MASGWYGSGNLICRSDSLMRSDSRLFLQDPETGCAAGTSLDVVTGAIQFRWDDAAAACCDRRTARRPTGQTGTVTSTDYG